MNGLWPTPSTFPAFKVVPSGKKDKNNINLYIAAHAVVWGIYP
jgi:hypothetical protein